MTARVKLREISNEESIRLLRIVRRGPSSVPGTHADVVDDQDVGADLQADRLGDRVIGAVVTQQCHQGPQGMPGDGLDLVDRQGPSGSAKQLFPAPLVP